MAVKIGSGCGEIIKKETAEQVMEKKGEMMLTGNWGG